MASGGLDISGKGPAVIAAALGLIICLFMAAVLLAVIIGPRGFQSAQGILNLLVATGIMPQSALAQAAPFQRVVNEGARAGSQPQRGRKGAAGAAANDAARPPVPGWDPVLRADSQDLAGLDPDEAVERALGRGVARTGETPVPVLSGGRVLMVSPAAPGSAVMVAAAPPAAAAAGTAAPGAGAAPAAAPAAAQPAAAPAEPVRQVLPPPAGARTPLPAFAVELAFFLDAEQATRYAASLQGRGITVRLVDQLDEAGRSWTYVRSPAFTDSVVALAYASHLERMLGIVATLVTEPAPPREGG
jgi:hypothetical protein